MTRDVDSIDNLTETTNSKKSADPIGRFRRGSGNSGANRGKASGGTRADAIRRGKRPKHRILLWGGVLAGQSPKLRLMVAVVLAVVSATLAFTQLGFAGIGMPGQYSVYAVMLLLPLAITALLLGTLPSLAMGLFSGVVLYGHATAMPLDFYELSFVTPLTSVIMLGVCGFLLGVFFAIALRNDPQGVKRVIYIAIVCIMISWLYSVGFFANVIVQMAVDLANNGYVNMTDKQASALVSSELTHIFLRLGDIGLQAWVDAVFMVAVCAVSDVIARRIIRRTKPMGLRSVFATWLFIVVLLAFLVTSGVSFAAITLGKVTEADANMKAEVEYLCKQLDSVDARADALVGFLKKENIDLLELDDGDLEKISAALSMDRLLDGYSAEADGIVMIAVPVSERLAKELGTVAADAQQEENAGESDGASETGGSGESESGAISGADEQSGEPSAAVAESSLGSGEAANSAGESEEQPDEELDELAETAKQDYEVGAYSAFERPSDYAVFMSDDEETFPENSYLSDVVDNDMIEAITQSAETGEMRRAVFDGSESDLARDIHNLLSDHPNDDSASESSAASSDGSSSAESASGSAAESSSASASSGSSDAADPATAAQQPADSQGGLLGGQVIRSHIVFLYAKKSPYGTIIIMYPDSKVFADRSSVMAWTSLSIFVLLFAVFVLVFQLLKRVVVSRIDETNDVLGLITGGNLDARVEVRDPSEFGSLSEGINTTVDALKGWISEAETRMDSELATARTIQESALPRIFPPYPDIQRFDVYASMVPAREVGGDFYDFFLIGNECDSDSGQLGFVVADVSGKGVPAALFMMKAMTLIRDYLINGVEVGEAVENANRQLCEGNEAGMFVTAWVGVLDYATGHVEYVNAGHNPPLLWQVDSWRWLTDKSGLPLGLFDSFPYTPYSLECGIGDEFLLYTDGVTEAMSVSGELYGEERLEVLANENFTLHPRRLVHAVRADVARHAEGAEQSDDITVLSLEVGVPPELTAMLVVPADVKELPHVNKFIHSELDRRLCPLRVQTQLDIAVEELFVNVCHYAYPDATPENPGTVRVSYTYSADPPSVHIGIADDGIPYNPLAKPDAVTPDDIMEVPIGGLGILMAKRSVDDMTYERLDGSNIVTILKKW